MYLVVSQKDKKICKNFNSVDSPSQLSRSRSCDISGKTNYAPKLLHCLIAEFLVNFYLFFKEFEEGICLDKCCVLWGHFIFISVSTTGKIFFNLNQIRLCSLFSFVKKKKYMFAQFIRAAAFCFLL